MDVRQFLRRLYAFIHCTCDCRNRRHHDADRCLLWTGRMLCCAPDGARILGGSDWPAHSISGWHQLERFGTWLALVANIGVVGGLVLLAVELRHNTQVVRAQAVAGLLTGQTSAETSFMGDDTAAAMATAIASPDSLSDEEILRMWAYLNTAVISAEQTYSMYSLGLATEEDRKAAASKVADWLSFPFGIVWWNEMKTNFPSDLAGDIDVALADRDPLYLQRQLEGMKKGLLELRRTK
jgi:hypothetical protein